MTRREREAYDALLAKRARQGLDSDILRTTNNVDGVHALHSAVARQRNETTLDEIQLERDIAQRRAKLNRAFRALVVNKVESRASLGGQMVLFCGDFSGRKPVKGTAGGGRLSSSLMRDFERRQLLGRVFEGRLSFFSLSLSLSLSLSHQTCFLFVGRTSKCCAGCGGLLRLAKAIDVGLHPSFDKGSRWSV
jgi:hypothetical protein